MIGRDAIRKIFFPSKPLNIFLHLFPFSVTYRHLTSVRGHSGNGGLTYRNRSQFERQKKLGGSKSWCIFAANYSILFITIQPSDETPIATYYHQRSTLFGVTQPGCMVSRSTLFGASQPGCMSPNWVLRRPPRGGGGSGETRKLYTRRKNKYFVKFGQRIIFPIL